ncbi:MAG: hypothetical protein JWO99_106 [Candidatus Saccharibacteria bacterium]|nr:hypothetical protein [Candidatus Saccharibacteria bacterium]
MNERLHLPPSQNPVPDHSSLIFLAGPIQGSPDWQNPVAEELLRYLPNAHVATPRRNTTSHDEFDYNEQVLWELKHLERSHTLGVISFWFAARDFALEYEEGRSYAQTSRVEIGRALGWCDAHPFPLVVGFDPEYTPNGGGNERYLRAMLGAKGIAVYDSIDTVIAQTIEQLPSKF